MDHGPRITKAPLTYTEIITDELWCVLGMEMGIGDLGDRGINLNPNNACRVVRDRDGRTCIFDNRSITFSLSKFDIRHSTVD